MYKDENLNFYSGFLPDKRIGVRAIKTLKLMIKKGTSIVNKMANDNAEKIAIYRMLNNNRFSHKDMMEASFKKCAENIDTDHVLVIQDTTEFNYHGIKEKLLKNEDEDIGPTSRDNIAGYFCHPGLVINPENDTIYGFSSALIYNRKWDKKNRHERDYKNLPIEEKESYRWIETAEISKRIIGEETRMTIIGDRESDIYEEFLQVPDVRTDVLVRAKANRRLVGEDEKLFEYISEQSIRMSFPLDVSGKNKRAKRTAKMELRFTNVTIDAPKKNKGKKKPIKLTVIEVRESSRTVPEKEKAILWRLLTTHEIKTIDQAMQCVEWYKKRWLIEELFRVLKTKGFRIESSQLSSGEGLKKLLALTLEAAVKVMALKLSLTQDIKRAASTMFSPTEIALLHLLTFKYEGKTKKQKNPYPANSLAWCAWTIARLAGWSGYISQGPPGYITIKEGYDRFKLQLEGYLIKKKDVYKD